MFSGIRFKRQYLLCFVVIILMFFQKEMVAAQEQNLTDAVVTINISQLTNGSQGSGYQFVNNVLTFTSSGNGNTYQLSGSKDDIQILVQNGTNLEMTVDNVKINNENYTPFAIEPGASVKLSVAGSSSFTCNATRLNALTGRHVAGIWVPAGANIEISGDGFLEAAGGEYSKSDQQGGFAIGGAGIGAGVEQENSGTVAIKGDVKIKASGGGNHSGTRSYGGAGIGGTRYGNNGVVLIEENAEVEAVSGGNAADLTDNNNNHGAAGIGGGSDGNGGVITIRGNARVNAYGGGKGASSAVGGGAGIGGGFRGNGETITIGGSASVYAEGGGVYYGDTSFAHGGAGIGGGGIGSGGSIIIEGSAEVIAVGSGIHDGNTQAHASGGAGIGGGERGSGGEISITGGRVTAFGGGEHKNGESYTACGIGWGGGIDPGAENTKIHISGDAEVAAYAGRYQHLSQNVYPAIGATVSSGDVNVVNAYIITGAVDAVLEAVIEVYEDDWAAPVSCTSELRLPADYMCFAFTTGNSSVKTNMKVFVDNRLIDVLVNADEIQSKDIISTADKCNVKPVKLGYTTGLTIEKTLTEAAGQDQIFVFQIRHHKSGFADPDDNCSYAVIKIEKGSDRGQAVFENMERGYYTVTELDANWSYTITDTDNLSQQEILSWEAGTNKKITHTFLFENEYSGRAWVHGKESVRNLFPSAG